MVSEAMELRVHNHDPEHGPGLACRESLIGDCLRAELSRLSRELEAAREIIRDLVDREPIYAALQSKYVEVRIDGGTWDDARRFVGLDRAGDDDVTQRWSPAQ